VSPDFTGVARLIDDARSGRAFPAACIEVGRRDEAIWQYATGRLTYDDDAPATSSETVFDLASLTKVIATAPLLMQLVARRRMLLSTPVRRLVPDWRGRDRQDVTVIDLLEHCAGLTAWWDFYKRNHTAREFAHEIAELPLEYRPRTRSIYSDLGFLLLGFIVADRGDLALDSQFDALLGDTGLRFRPPADRQASIAPTEHDTTWRGRLLVGEVHDENAAELGGVAGHAGLFGSAPAVGAFARLVLETLRQPTRLGTPWLQQRFLRRSAARRHSRGPRPLPASPGNQPCRGARAHSGGTRCCRLRRAARACREPLLVTRGLRARRCGSTRSATCMSCC
jgi:CubicO group peptidase (beta-lactamase class C family)